MSFNHEFRLILSRWPDDSEWDAIADTCHDAGWGRSNGVPQAEFSRTAGSLVEAISSAVHELQEYHNIEATAVEPIHMVWDPDIADRLGMTVEELTTKIAASPVAHSKPMMAQAPGGGVSFYHWPDIVDWLAAHGIPAQTYDKTIQAADTALTRVESHDRSHGRMVRAIAYELKRVNMWRMPDWMEPYRTFIAETGGNEIEELLFSFEHDRNMVRTNFPRFAIACMARAQVGLLQRLHEDGCLPPAPNTPGGW
jgi:hypothetical protein